MNLIYKSPLTEAVPEDLAAMDWEWIPPKYRQLNRNKVRPPSAKSPIRVRSPTNTTLQQVFFRTSAQPKQTGNHPQFLVTNAPKLSAKPSFKNNLLARSYSATTLRYATSMEALNRNKDFMRFNATFGRVRRSKTTFKRGWKTTPLYEDPPFRIPKKGKVPALEELSQRLVESIYIGEEQLLGKQNPEVIGRQFSPQKLLYEKEVLPQRTEGDPNLKKKDRPLSPIEARQATARDFENADSAVSLLELEIFEDKDLPVHLKKQKRELERLAAAADQYVRSVAAQHKKVRSEKKADGVTVHHPLVGEQQFGMIQKHELDNLQNDLKKMSRGVQKLVQQVHTGYYMPGELNMPEEDMREIRDKVGNLELEDVRKMEKLMQKVLESDKGYVARTDLQEDNGEESSYDGKTRSAWVQQIVDELLGKGAYSKQKGKGGRKNTKEIKARYHEVDREKLQKIRTEITNKNRERQKSRKKTVTVGMGQEFSKSPRRKYDLKKSLEEERAKKLEKARQKKLNQEAIEQQAAAEETQETFEQNAPIETVENIQQLSQNSTLEEQENDVQKSAISSQAQSRAAKPKAAADEMRNLLSALDDDEGEKLLSKAAQQMKDLLSQTALAEDLPDQDDMEDEYEFSQDG